MLFAGEFFSESGPNGLLLGGLQPVTTGRGWLLENGKGKPFDGPPHTGHGTTTMPLGLVK